MPDAPLSPFAPADSRASATRLPSAGHKSGILPLQQIKHMVREGQIETEAPLSDDQYQPASLDLRLGGVAYRVRASFLPGPESTVAGRIKQLDAYPIDLSSPGGAVLERGCVYVIPLQESLQLQNGTTGFANPKSSTGRLDILTRLITDRSASFDKVERGYRGPLYVEVAPRTFSVVVRAGSRLNQIRFRWGSSIIAASEMQRLFENGELVSGNDQTDVPDDNLVGVTVDLAGAGQDCLVGWRAKRHTDRIDIDTVGTYDPLNFWEPIRNHRNSTLILNPDDFYILATHEDVKVPPNLAAEMVAYDTSVGEFRVHYAGFFDPGFGVGDGGGSKAVLEVRSHEVPFMLEHRQKIGWLRYERLTDEPSRIYGRNMRSNYQGQRLALAKQFAPNPFK